MTTNELKRTLTVAASLAAATAIASLAAAAAIASLAERLVSLYWTN